MKKDTKYRLIRTVSELLVITTLATGISHTTTKIKYPSEVIPYTQEDTIHNLVFSEELSNIINEEKITFSNPELETIVKKELGGTITKEGLLSLNKLQILNTLSNNDLSDLKYLPNLTSLDIYDNNINIEDLKYNQDLMFISFNNCTLSNTQYLPNSIETLFVDNTTITDKETIIPYYATHIYFKKSVANNIRLKNPSILEKLYITSDVMLDMNNLKDCTNLKEITIFMSSNIKNSHILGTLPSLESIYIDEYSAIWLDINTLSKLPLPDEDKLIVGGLISKLDSIANTLIPDKNISEEEKIKRITLYLLEKLDYDHEAIEAPDELDDRVETYNVYPLSTSLEGDLGICINYSAMYQALSNRVGLDTYQLFNDVHAWNATKVDGEYKGYDLTYLELGPVVEIKNLNEFYMLSNTTVEKMIQNGEENKLCFYEFDLDQILDNNHIAEYTPEQIKDYILNIGYINDNSLIKILYKNEAKIFKMSTFMNSYIVLLLTTIIFETLKYRKERKYYLINEEN
jgi:hypothetical protein